MKYVVQILIAEENVYRNFGCVMVIGKKKFDYLKMNIYFILVIVMMEVMKIHGIVVCKKCFSIFILK